MTATTRTNTKLSPSMLATLTALAAHGGRIEGYLNPMNKAGMNMNSMMALVRREMVERVSPLIEGSQRDFLITEAGRAALPQDTPQESATEEPVSAPTFSLPFEPSYYTTDAGTEVRNGNGELMGWTYRLGTSSSWVAKIPTDTTLGSYESDAAAQHAILMDYATPHVAEITEVPTDQPVIMADWERELIAAPQESTPAKSEDENMVYAMYAWYEGSEYASRNDVIGHLVARSLGEASELAKHRGFAPNTYVIQRDMLTTVSEAMALMAEERKARYSADENVMEIPLTVGEFLAIEDTHKSSESIVVDMIEGNRVVGYADVPNYGTDCPVIGNMKGRKCELWAGISDEWHAEGDDIDTAVIGLARAMGIYGGTAKIGKDADNSERIITLPKKSANDVPTNDLIIKGRTDQHGKPLYIGQTVHVDGMGLAEMGGRDDITGGVLVKPAYARGFLSVEDMARIDSNVSVTPIPDAYIERVKDMARRDHGIKVYDLSCPSDVRSLEYNAEWSREGWGAPLSFTNMRPVVVKIMGGDKPDSDGSLWAVDVQYATSGACAVYGVKADGTPELYAD